ncbi:mucoidy inhibitor MuiA family protein [Rhizomonospora bruguierae]|uniref:mucoidy inhibitor MuiA family protein n=1 Tax=Rhizomonospora bruguierae TaxID=1581705 RepID=UPI001BCE4419|nr:mucoidy inhibitor MuiA family protein [Micromonospora sp. NBRC 107566]
MTETTQQPAATDAAAPIVAVTVYPDRARVTRRAEPRLPPGEHRVELGPLPAGLDRESVRVGGHGPATVLGVDVVTRRHARTPDGAVAGLEERRRGIAAELAELTDLDAVQQRRAGFLERLAERAGGTFARALAGGEADPAAVAGFVASVGEQLAAVKAEQREVARRREDATARLAAADRELVAVRQPRTPDRLAAVVTVAVREEGDVRLELSYVVGAAGWTCSYDLRLTGERLALTWFGLVTQHTGEDWPECDLRLSTARPAATAGVPELDPWFLDRPRPMPAQPMMRSRMAVPGGTAGMAADMVAAALPPAPAAAKLAEVVEAAAVVEQGVSAATYRPVRAVAVPADGSAHRATVAALDLTATLDYVTAPVRSPDAHLRATAVNGSPHTLLPGPAAVFHDADFVGSTTLETWAPGEEVELALGVDDRVRVERELVRRTATKVTLGSSRRREAEYRISVANHTPGTARVTVLDQIPVSRDEGISVRELRADPEPAERTDLGVLTWRLTLGPGDSQDIHLGLRVELARNVEMTGWRE